MNYSKKLRILKKGYCILKSYVKYIDIIIRGFCLYFTSRFFRLNFDLKLIWDIDPRNLEFNKNNNLEFMVFGITVDSQKINWHRDYQANFEFPRNRFYKMHIEQYFDKGIDVKFPWEVSRFHFAIFLASAYCKNNEEKYYNQFKWIINDWIDENPYLYGINWVCTMDVSIRSINWILACNLFGTVFENDREFKKIIGKSLVQHAEYISNFPEIYENEHTTNHTSSDYAGLLFLSLTLINHTKAQKWLKQAVTGLEKCMEYQVYEDGVDFEASVPYHRLVLEIFGFSALVCMANNVQLSIGFYRKLFKMFEYTSAYLDCNGNAPQVGDNDSGRILIFNKTDEQDHSYLLDLGERIYKYHFESQCKKRNKEFLIFLPLVNQIEIERLGFSGIRRLDQSIAFVNGGAYILKNDNFLVFISCFPIGMNGRGGHNHYDFSSFTLSYRGNPIIIDPGTYTYTRDRNMRNTFKQASYHNVSVVESGLHSCLRDDYWSIDSRYLADTNIAFNGDNVNMEYRNDLENITYKRRIELFNNSINVMDDIFGPFCSYCHFHPHIEVRKINNNTVIIDKYNLVIQTSTEIKLLDYLYSPSYNILVKAIKLVINTQSKLRITFKLISP